MDTLKATLFDKVRIRKACHRRIGEHVDVILAQQGVAKHDPPLLQHLNVRLAVNGGVFDHVKHHHSENSKNNTSKYDDKINKQILTINLDINNDTRDELYSLHIINNV